MTAKSNHVLIDGYNLLHAMGLMRERMGTAGLYKARQALAGQLKGVYGQAAGQVMVVFDAAKAPPGAPEEENHQGIRIRYAVHQDEADDLIEELIRHDADPRRLLVVSDDYRLREAALRRKCMWAGCEDYLESLPALRHRTRRPTLPGDEPKPCNPKEREHWLREFAELEKDPDVKRLLDLDRFGDE